MNWMTNRNLILLLILIALGVTLPVINSFPIALDEPFTIYHAQQDLGDLSELFVNENNPPLHFLLLHFWIKVAGISAWSVRILSLIFSIATIPFLFRLSFKLTNKYGAIAVVLIYIFSNFLHYHAMEARAYSLFVFLFTLIVYSLYRLLFEKNKKSVILLSLANLCLLYTHYLAGFVLFVELCILIYFYKELKGTWLNVIFGGVVVLLGYIPGLWLLWVRLSDVSQKGTWVPAPEYSELYGNIVRFLNGKYAFVLLLSLLAVIVCISYYKSRSLPVKRILSKQNQFIFLCFIFPYFGMFIVSKFFEPVFLDRYLLYTNIPLIISLVIFMFSFSLVENKPVINILVVIPILLFFQLKPDNNREPDVMTDWIKGKNVSDKNILICPPFYELTFFYHYNRLAFSDYKTFPQNKEKDHVLTLYSKGELSEINLRNDVFYVDMDAAFLFPENGILQFLSDNYQLIDSAGFKGNAMVYHFSKK